MRLDELRTHLSRANSEILIISPYLTLDTLSDVLSGAPEGIDVTVICSWRDRDLLFGSSHLETYHLCRDNGWALRVDHDRMPRTIHLKAYVVDGEHAMIGSANMTGRGMGDNIESLLPVSMEVHPTLFEAINDSQQGSIEVDDAIYKHFFERVQNFPDREKPDFPELKPIHGATASEIIDLMPTEPPTLEQLLQLQEISDALTIRGINFSKIRNHIRGKPLLGKSGKNINERTLDIMREIIENDHRFDIQKRYTSHCLVWKIHHILNEEIRRHVKPYIGKPLRDLGLDESLWDSGTQGNKVQHARELCLGLLPEELRNAIMRLKTHSGTLRLKIDGRALYPRKFGESLVFTDQEGQFLNLSPEQMLPEKKLRNQLWFPLFCIFEAPKKIKLGDFRLMGLGLWESNFNFVQDLEADLEDITRVLSEQAEPFHDNPFKEGIPRRVIHTKIADAKGNPHLPLGHPKRKMSRYVNLASLTDIAQEILSHDH